MKRNADEGLRRIGVVLGAILALTGVVIWFGWVLSQLDFEWMEPGELMLTLPAVGLVAMVGAQTVFSMVWSLFYSIRWIIKGFSAGAGSA